VKIGSWDGLATVFALRAGLAAALALVVGINLLWWRANVRAARHSESVARTYQAIATLEEMLARSTDIETAQRGFALTGDSDFLTPFIQATNRIPELSASLRALAVSPALKARLENLEPLLTAHVKAYRDRIESRSKSGVAFEQRFRQESKQRMDGIRNLIGEMVNDENRVLAQDASESMQITRLERLINIAGAGVSVGLLLAVFTALWRENSRRRFSEAALRQSCELVEHQVEQRTAELRRSQEGLKQTMEKLEQDITRRKQAEQQVRRAKIEWERTFDCVPDLIAVLGKDDRIVHANRAMAERMGLTPEDCVGRICYESVHGMECAIPGCPHQAAMADGKQHITELHEPRLGGDFLVSATPLLDDQGACIGSVHIARDITERKRLEREILEASDSELSQLGRDLHDGVGQQLTALGLFVASLQNEVRAQSPQLLPSIKNLGGELRETIRQVRLLSHGLSPIPFEGNGLASALGDLAEHTRSMAKIECTFEADAEIVVADTHVATHLFRISQEAVNNALKHSGATTVHLSLHAAGRELTLGISDDGQGFSTITNPGNGLGLRAMKYRADLIGGRLEIHSKPGEGTRIICAIQNQPRHHAAKPQEFKTAQA